MSLVLVLALALAATCRQLTADRAKRSTANDRRNILLRFARKSALFARDLIELILVFIKRSAVIYRASAPAALRGARARTHAPIRPFGEEEARPISRLTLIHGRRPTTNAYLFIFTFRCFIMRKWTSICLLFGRKWENFSIELIKWL